MPQLVDRTLCLLYRVLPAAHSQEERQTADAFALWAGEWIDLMHHMGFVVEIPPDLQFAAASTKARRTGKRPILNGPWARLSGCCDALYTFETELWPRFAAIKDTVEFCPGDHAGCATALAVLWLLKGGPRVAGCIGGSALHGPDAGPALEEVALSLYAQGLDTGLTHLDKLPEATALLRETGQDISHHKAVLGADIFAVESGIHVDGIVKKPFLYEPYTPATVGLERQIVVGKHSGRVSLRIKARQLGLSLPRAEEEHMLALVQQLAEDQQCSLTDAQFLDLCHACHPPESLSSARTDCCGLSGATASVEVGHA